MSQREGLWLPGVQPRPLVGTCSTCGDEFDLPRQRRDWEKHVGKCANEHLAEIMGARADQKRRMAIFTESWNPDVDAHLAKVGERMIREGRLEMRPNERIRNE